MITFCSNFPGGNGQLVGYVDDTNTETITFLAEQKLGEPAPMWFCFDIDGLKRPLVQFVIANAHQFLLDEPVETFENCTPVYQETGGTWKRANGCKVRFGADLMPRISFQVECTSSALRVAFCFPYTLAELEAAFPVGTPFERTVIGYSTKGRPIVRYRAGAGGGKKEGVFITCRQHAGEVGGSWVLDGLIRWLSDPENAGWEQTLELWIIPFVDIDGVEEGCYGKDQKAGDLNRSWRFPFAPRAEISAVMQDAMRWRTHCAPMLYLDMHSPACEVLEVLMNIYEAENGKNAIERTLMEVMNHYVAEAGLNLVKPSIIHESSYQGSSQGNSNKARTFFESHQIPTALLEVTYQGDWDGKRYSVAEYQRYGACLAKGLIDLSSHSMVV